MDIINKIVTNEYINVCVWLYLTYLIVSLYVNQYDMFMWYIKLLILGVTLSCIVGFVVPIVYICAFVTRETLCLLCEFIKAYINIRRE